MAWHLQYGSYAFAERTCYFEIQKSPEHGRNGQRIAVLERWTVRGHIDGTSEADITTKANTLELAMADGYDLTFYGASGPTRHVMVSANSTNGVEIKDFKWLNAPEGQRGSGAEYVLRRSFMFVAQARFLDLTGSGIVFEHRALRAVGNGGPKWRLVPSLNGPVQYQQVQAYTPFSAVQTDIRIGLISTPLPASPLFPSSVEHTDMREIVTESAQNLQRITSTHYPVRSKYVFESAAVIV